MSAIGSEGTITGKFAVDNTDFLRKIQEVQTHLKTLQTSITGLQGTASQFNIAPMTNQFSQAGVGMQTAGDHGQTFVQRMQGVQGNLLNVATSVGTFSASIFGIDAAMDNLERAEIAIDQQRIAIERTTNTLQAAELRLTEGRANGTLTLEEQEVLENRIAVLRERAEVGTERLSFMQQNLNEDYNQFASQILPQVITASLSGVTAFTSIIQAVGKSDGAINLLNKTWTGFTKIFSSGASSAATSASSLSGALQGMQTSTTAAGNAASSLLVPALSAAGATIATLGTVIALYVTNAFGARDAMHALGESVGDAVPQLTGFLNFLEETGRLWSNLTTGPPIFAKSIGEMAHEIDVAKSNIGESFANIETSFNAFTTNVQSSFQTVGSRYQEFQAIFADQAPYVKATAGTNLLMGTIDQLGKSITEGKNVSKAQLQLWAGDVSAWASQITANFEQAGAATPVLITEIKRLVTELNSQLANAGKMDFATLKEKISAILSNISDTVIKWGPEFTTSLNDIIKKGTDPIGYNLDIIKAKLAEMKVPPEFGINMGVIAGNVYDLTTAFTQNLFASQATSGEMSNIAKTILPQLVQGYAKLNPEIDTENELLQLLVNAYGDNAKGADVLTQQLLKEAEARGIKKQVTGENIVQLTEEQKKIQELAKAYFGATVSSEEQIRSYEHRVEMVSDVIDSYNEEIANLKELRTQYGENEISVYGVNDATQELITNLQEQVIAEQELTLAGIDVVQILDDTTASQIKLNAAMIEGKTAAADFVTELVTGAEQAQAYGDALATHVMDVLEEMPESIGKFASEFENLLPNLFGSLEEFQGKIEPFDKESLKAYKEELKDLDVPKSLKNLFVDSAQVWQDKEEIMAEGDALFAGMAGALVHNFEEIDPKDVTKFLDEIEEKLTSLEESGMSTQFTDNIRGMVDEIRNADDPVAALMANFDNLKAAMDPEAIDKVSAALKVFGGDTVMGQAITQSATLSDALLLVADTDFSNLMQQLDQIIEKTGKLLAEGVGGKEGLQARFQNIGAETKQHQMVASKQGAGGGGATAEENQAATMTTAWQNAQAAISASMSLIQTSITGMRAVIDAETVAMNAAVLLSQGVWSTFSTSVATYGTSISTNVTTMATTSNASLLTLDTQTTASHTIWSGFSTSMATYTSSMTTNVGSFSSSAVTSLGAVDTSANAVWKTMSGLSTSWATYMKSMTSAIQSWESATTEAFANVEEGAGKAQEAVEGLQEAIDALKSKTVTIKVNVDRGGGGGTSSAQYGGAKILDDPQYVFAGEGHKPEINLTFPLDKMSQSHAKSEFRLPFNLDDLRNVNPPEIKLGSNAAGGTNKMSVPDNLISNIRINAQLNVDLGNQIRTIIREEISSRAVSRIDRIPH